MVEEESNKSRRRSVKTADKIPATLAASLKKAAILVML